MKISKIQRLRDCRIFREFTWPGDLPSFERLNLIFGWNASGKTTLSTLLLGLERGQNLLGGQCTLQIDGRSREFAAITEKLANIRVFNRDSAAREVFERADAELPPVFVLGEVNVEKSKTVDALKVRLIDIRREASEAEVRVQVATDTLDAFYSERARAVKNLLTAPGGGPFNNYDKSDFRAAISRVTDTPIALVAAQRNSLIIQKDSKQRPRLPALTQSYPNLVDLTKRVDAILKKSVTSKAIQALIDDPELAGWVKAGVTLHKHEGADGACKFCGQPMPQSRIQQLEDHFNDEFDRFQRELDQTLALVTGAAIQAKAVTPPAKEQLYDHLAESYETAKNTFVGQRQMVVAYLTLIEKAIEVKKQRPFMTMELRNFLMLESPDGEERGLLMSLFMALLGGIVSVSAHSGVDALKRMDKVIGDHNHHSDNFSTELAAARKALEADEIALALPRYRELMAALEEARRWTTEGQAAVQHSLAEIERLERDLQTHASTATWLTNAIASYLGRQELVFEARPTGYAITRGGAPAMHLSEGERMAIAFLYFLRSLRDSSFDLKTGIVVIDDPVSSMDENSIYSAFGYMKEHIEEAGQIIIMTHNFRLFSLVRNWFNHLGKGRHNRHYMLDAEYTGPIRTPVLAKLDPLLSRFETEYHYLFKRVSIEANRPAGQALESCYPMPNIARRLLESFLAYRCPGGGTLHHKISQVSFDNAKRSRLFRFVDVHSHDGQLAVEAHDISILRETKIVMQDLLGYIKAGDPQHYEQMVAATQDQGDA